MHQQISSSLLMSLPVDPDDGLVADEVGPWATEKHERLKRYIDASRGSACDSCHLRVQGRATSNCSVALADH